MGPRPGGAEGDGWRAALPYDLGVEPARSTYKYGPLPCDLGRALGEEAADLLLWGDLHGAAEEGYLVATVELRVQLVYG